VCPLLADDPSTAPSQNERRTHSAAIHRRAHRNRQTAPTQRDHHHRHNRPARPDRRGRELRSRSYPKSAIRFLFTQTLRAGGGIFSPFCVSERAPPVRYALRRRFRSHPGAFWDVLAAAPSAHTNKLAQRRRECRTRDHYVSGMTHPSCMKRAQRSRIAVNTASIAELIFKNVCLPCRTILPAV
jgi:hypothetical protein